jgi:N-terminal domain of reverse transcriptase/Group II intron, maturase-specific domain/HNH endonuclease
MSAAATLAGAASGGATDWHSINWKKVWATVRRLQARIVKAVRASRWGRVKALVYLLTHSFSGRAAAIWRVVSNSGARTPGVDGQTRIRNTLRTAGRSWSAGELIEELNAQIKGWALYHRHASSKRTFAYVDDQIFKALWRWCRRRHRNQSARWIRRKYFMSQGSRSWVFTGILLTSKGEPYRVKLMGAADVRIVYHVLIQHEANPYDPNWESYYEGRLQAKLAATLMGRDLLQAVYEHQAGRCAHCGIHFTDSTEWHLHHRHWRVYGGGETLDNLQLLHANCHRQIHSQGLTTESSCVSRETLVEGLSCVSGN